MEIFGYKVDLHINIWQRVDMLVHAGTKEEADARIIKLVKEAPLSLDNGDENIERSVDEYLCDTESLLESTATTPTVEVYDANCGIFETKNALYTNLKEENASSIKMDSECMVTAINEISEWANASHAYLCNHEGYPRGYRDGISQAKTIILEILSKIDAKQDKSKQTSDKLTLEEIQAEYHENDVCMGELLAHIQARRLNMEEAFQLNIAARKWADGDEFYRVINGEKPEKL